MPIHFRCARCSHADSGEGGSPLPAACPRCGAATPPPADAWWLGRSPEPQAVAPPAEAPRRVPVALVAGGGAALLVLACVAVAALVSVLVVALQSGPGSSSGTSSGSKSGSNQPQKIIALDPAQRLDTEAAVRNNWALIAHDEFDGDALDEDHWSPYRGRTTDDVGQHDPDNLTVSDGTLKLTSRGNTSAGMAWNDGQKYGRWEARVRSQAGNGYGPVMLLWPDSEKWPEDGEVDIMEVPGENRDLAHFVLHAGEANNLLGSAVKGDFSQWHTFAVDWLPDRVTWYVDGRAQFTVTDRTHIPDTPMHLAIQLDQGPVKDWMPAPDATTPPQVRLQVDWVHVYSWAGAPAPTKTSNPSATPMATTAPTTKPSRS